MKNNELFGLIMAGGVGSRFWPMSTEEKPKQFLDILGLGKSLLQLTFERLSKQIPKEQIYILTNTSYAKLVKEHLPMIQDSQIICEPERKNTAPCILYAALKIKQINPNSTLVISPSDHLILQEDRFHEQLSVAIDEAQKENLITLGIKPTRPDVGYGYIEFESTIVPKAGEVAKVNQFREKPSLQTAKEFLNAGNYYWNAGIFIWKTDAILSAFQKYQLDLYNLFLQIRIESSSENSDLAMAFSKCNDISIDYAILEHADNISVVLTDFDWSDLGTWGSLSEQTSSNDQGNATINADAYFYNASQDLVITSDSKKNLIDGLNNFIVVDSKDKLLIIHKENESKLKSYLQSMGEIV